MRNYAAVKERLVASVRAGGTAVIGVDDDWCAATAERVAAAGKNVVRISVRHPLTDGLYIDGEQIVQAAGGTGRAVALLGNINTLRGIHNAQNAACAAAATLALGLDDRAIQRGLWSYPGLPHRMEEIGQKDNVLFINDSKATNADSTAQALACFHNVFWIAGGKAKTGGITSLARFFPRIRKAYLIGEAAPDFATTLAGEVTNDVVEKLDRAVALASQDAEASGLSDAVVLLSPACASFDQYPNFEVRGEAFRALVKAIPGVAQPSK
jgi:UDP-N-acetylmuramoylalanine--D-glutamate ligase